MTINKQIFEDVLSGKLKGTFVLRNRETYKSEYLRRNTAGDFCSSHPYRIYVIDKDMDSRNVVKVINASYTPDGMFFSSGEEYDMDIIDFIPDKNMETKDMEIKELKIEVPEGFEIDKKNSSFEKIVFKKKEDTKPRSWEKYCESKKDEHAIGYFIGTDSDIFSCNWCICEVPDVWRNVLPSKENTEEFRAMMQLRSLRQSWIGDWEPDWKEVDYKYCISVCCNIFQINTFQHTQAPLSFPTKEMAKDFMNCFIDLLEIAKPLL